MNKNLVKWMSAIALAAIVMTLSVGLASAQEQPPRPPREGRPWAGRQFRPDGPIRDALGRIAEELGLTPQEIVQQMLEDDMTLAEVIEANGGDVDAIVEELGNAARERIREAMHSRLSDRPVADLLRDVMNAVTEATGLTVQEIMAQMRDDDLSLAEVIAANGGDVEAVKAEIIAAATEKINAAVAEGTLTQERADQMLANLPDRVSAAMEHRPSEVRPREVARAAAGLARELVNAVADATGLTPREILQQAREDEMSLAEVIAANGGDVEAIVAQVVAAATEQINAAVAEGRLTQERADQMLANLEDAINRLLDGRPGERPFRPGAEAPGSEG